MVERSVGVIGATSLVGRCLLPILVESGWRVVAFTRKKFQKNAPLNHSDHITWQSLKDRTNIKTSSCFQADCTIEYWVYAGPIWTFAEYSSMLLTYRAKRVVAVSSTSRFTKPGSSNESDQAMARKLDLGESFFCGWADTNHIKWVIIRPTLIYGLGLDRNISAIASLIRRFRLFPLLGNAHGLRQPVHVMDVASACASALSKPNPANRSYNISGEEILTYRVMVERIFAALGKSPRFLTVPLWAFNVAAMALRPWQRFSHLSAAMAERMNLDMVFDHADATRDLGFAPRPFHLSSADLPK